MSPVVTSPVGDSPSNELWAGKSRNAKAQARHRAKRKAYIEQLEQTVSKLQTALALSAEDVANLPSTQVKLRELKEENDSLRAEIRKLQAHPPATGYLVPPIQVHSPPLSDEYPRRSKRRKMSPGPVEDYSVRNTYLAPMEPLVDTMSSSQGNHASSRLLPPAASAFAPLQRNIYHLQHSNTMTQQHSPVDPPVPQYSREAMSPWTSFSTNPTAQPPWPLLTHHRRSSSGSSSSSESGPTYMTQPHTPMPSSYKSPLANAHIVTCEPTPKPYFDLNSEMSPAYTLPNELPVNTCEPAHIVSGGSSQDSGSAWSDVPPWSYSFVRMQ